MSNGFYYRDERLFCDAVDLNELAGTTNGPFYVYSKFELGQNLNSIKAAAQGFNFIPCYAVKANYNPQLLKIIASSGFGADVVSAGELYFAQKAGFPNEKIVFAGVGKTAAELELAISSGIHSLNIESAAELELAGQIAQKLQRRVNIALRINPDIRVDTHEYITTALHSNKFGIPVEEALLHYRQLKFHPWLNPAGVHVHIGSQITDVQPFRKAADELNHFVAELESMGIGLDFIDLGGGIGINYQHRFDAPNTDAQHLHEILSSYLNTLQPKGKAVLAELGRAIIGNTGLLISRVLYKKQTPVKNFTIVDAGMNNLIRPSLYRAWHEIVPLVKRSGPKMMSDIVGPVCESGDYFAKDRETEMLESGDFIAIGGAGAYGQSLSSHYNLRPRLAEFLIDGNQIIPIARELSIRELAAQYEW